MNKWKFTYMWWFSIYKFEIIIEAETKEEAYKKINSWFGFENIDIIKCELIN